MTAARDPHLVGWVTARLANALAGRIPDDQVPVVVDAILDAFPHLRFDNLRELGDPVGVLSLSARVGVRWRDGQWVEHQPAGGDS